ncbi:hypothetical protein MTO96_026485 [Rhipicephalus appendiculatus]
MPENLCTKVGEGITAGKFYHEVDVSTGITSKPSPEDVFVVTYFFSQWRRLGTNYHPQHPPGDTTYLGT